MDLMIKEFLMIMVVGVFLCSMTGTMLYFVWRKLYKVLEHRGLIHMNYILLKVIMFFYIFPVTLIFLLTYNQDGIIFSVTPLMAEFVYGISIIWCVGFMVSLLKYLRKRRKFLDHQTHMLVLDKEILSMMMECKNRVGVRKKIQLKQNTLPVAYVWGIWKTEIILPQEIEDRGKLEIILLHELIHVKHHDLMWKVIANFLCWFHWYLPVMKKVFQDFDDWSETYCDLSVYTLIQSRKRYFQVLLEMSKSVSKMRNELCSAIYENENGLMRRIQRAKKIGQMNHMKILTVCMFILCFSFSGVVSVAAASVGFCKGYRVIVNKTETRVMVNGEKIEKELVEKTKELRVPEKTEDLKVWKVIDGHIYFFKSKVLKERTEVLTKEIFLNKGQNVKVNFLIAQKDDKAVEKEKLHIGILKEDKTRCYVNCATDVVHEFSIKKSGYYRIFLMNESEIELEIAGDVEVK